MEAIQTVDKDVDVITITIAISGTDSTAANLFGCTATQIQIPTAFTGTSITFEVSIDKGVTFNQLQDKDGNAITYTVPTTGGSIQYLDKNIFAGIDQLKVIADAQAAERSIKIKPLVI